MKLNPNKNLKVIEKSMGWIDFETIELPDGTTINISLSESEGRYSVTVKQLNGREVHIEDYVISMKFSNKDSLHVLPEEIPEKVFCDTFQRHAFELFFNEEQLKKGEYKLNEIVVT